MAGYLTRTYYFFDQDEDGRFYMLPTFMKKSWEKFKNLHSDHPDYEAIESEFDIYLLRKELNEIKFRPL